MGSVTALNVTSRDLPAMPNMQVEASPITMDTAMLPNGMAVPGVKSEV